MSMEVGIPWPFSLIQVAMKIHKETYSSYGGHPKCFFCSHQEETLNLDIMETKMKLHE